MSVNEYDNRMARGRNRGGRPSKQDLAARPAPELVKFQAALEGTKIVIRMTCPSCGRQIVPKVAYTWLDTATKERRNMRCCQPCGARFELQRDERGNEVARVVKK